MEEKKVASGKVAIVVADIDEKVQQEIVEQTKVIFAEQAELKGKEKEVAAALRKFCDETYGKHWHVIVGANFGSNVSALAQKFLYFYFEEFAVLVFQTK